MASSELEQSFQKLGRLLVAEVEGWEQRTRSRRKQVVDDFAQSVEGKLRAAFISGPPGAPSRQETRRQARFERRRLRREEKRIHERENASALVGAFMLAAALACGAVAVLNLQLWWLLFVAFGFGTSGARNISLALDRSRERRELAAVGSSPTGGVTAGAPLSARFPHATDDVDGLCDSLLAELRESPDAVRSFVQNPEQTVEAMRVTCKALGARRQQLLGGDAKGQLARLSAHRAELSSKRDATGDPTARQQLLDALDSLEHQEQALKLLDQMTEQVDGEYTSLFVVLQELRTRVTVARSAGSSVQLEGLRQNVQRLNAELEAITQAVEETRGQHLQGLAPVEEISETDGAHAPPLRQR